MEPGLQISRLKSVFRRVMKQRGLKFKDLADHLGVSLATVKRILAAEELSLSRTLEICAWLDLTLSELESMASIAPPTEETYTEEQELFLSADPRFLAYLLLLHDGMTPSRIATAHDLKPRSTELYLRRLEQLGLIRVSPKGRVTTTRREPHRWRHLGPLTRAHHSQLLDRFFGYFRRRIEARIASGGPETPDSGLHGAIECGSMSRTTFDAFRREVTSVRQKYMDLGGLEEKVAGNAPVGKTALIFNLAWHPPGTSLEELENVFGVVTNI